MRNKTPDSSQRWYDELQSENTQALLDRLEAEMEKEEIEDTGLIMALTKLLDERTPVPASDGTPEESLKRFRADFAPVLDGDFEEPQTARRLHPVLRAALVACLCVIMLFAVASACGVNLIAEFLEWREESFVLHGKGSGQMVMEEPAEGEYASMAEAVASYGITDPVVPTWIPEGFEVQFVQAKDMSHAVNLTACYMQQEQEIRIKVYIGEGGGSDVHSEHSDTESVPYESNGVEFLISKNNEQYRTSWAMNNCICSINGDITEREIKQMIDSIFTTEG